MNENDAYHFHVEAPADWNSLPPAFVISGWFHSKIGARVADMRAVVDGVPCPGVWGLPRPDVAARWPDRGHTALFCGFRFPVGISAESRLICLEFLDSGPRWIEFWRVPVKAAAGITAAPAGLALDPRHIPGAVLRLLQRRQEKEMPPPREANVRPSPDSRFTIEDLANHLALEGSMRGVEQLPAPPFHGFVDDPHSHVITQFDKVFVRGWVFHETRRIVRLFATCGRGPELNELVCNQRRPDVAAAYPQFANARAANFSGLVDIDPRVPNPVPLLIHAELDDGSYHTVFVRRLWQLPAVTDDRPATPWSWGAFARELKTLRGACRAQQIALPGPSALWSAAAEARRLHIARATRKAGSWEWERLADYDLWLRRNNPTPRLETMLASAARATETDAPLLSLVVGITGADAGQLTRMIASVRAQSFRSWELLLAHAGRAPEALEQSVGTVTRADPRIRLLLPAPGGENHTGALNHAVGQASGAYVAFPEPDCTLPVHALLHVAGEVSADSSLELVYTDEDVIADSGRRRDPWFKGEWNPALALSGRFPGQLVVLKRSRVLACGGFRAPFEACAHHDLLLRFTEGIEPRRVRHVAQIGYHARRSFLEDRRTGAADAARAALDDSLSRRGWRARAFVPQWATKLGVPFVQIRWDPAILAENNVTIVVPTRDRIDLLQRCIQCLESTVDWRHARLVIVDDYSRDAKTVRYLKRLESRTDLRCRIVRPPDAFTPFNYSRLVNTGSREADTPLLLHLNNDVDALERGWLEDMVGWMSVPGIGVVGAKLVHANNTINHAGIVIGAEGGLADGPFVDRPEDDTEFLDWHRLARDVSAVTGACLLTRSALYSELGGFEETKFGVAYNDVDYCLRVLARGQRVLLTPQARLRHWGSATRGNTFYEHEHFAFIEQHGRSRERHVSPHQRLAGRTLQLQVEKHVSLGRVPRLHVLLVSHNLNHEGAPLFLLEYARWLCERERWSVAVVSTEDGPLRGSFEKLGATVKIIDRHRIAAAGSREELDLRIAEAAREIGLDDVDLVVGNTLVSWWAVFLAEAAGLPSVLYIHESVPLRRFFSRMVHPHMQWVASEAMQMATRVCFSCEATRHYFADLNDRDNFRILPGWVDTAAISAFKATSSRAELRAKHGFAEEDIVIANIGTVCARKGQHVFVHAVPEFLRHHAEPGRRHRFILVGGHTDDFQELLLRDRDRLGIPGIEVVMRTHEVYDFYALADLFVCTSFEESFPRVLLGSMAFELPFVTTNVHGIPEILAEMIGPHMIPPGDPILLAAAMRQVLDRSRTENSIAPAARSRVLRHYDAPKVLPRHADLAREAWLAGPGPRNILFP